MKGTIILFRLPPKTPHSIVNKFCKQFYGQDTSSHQGKYRYHRRGLLDDIPHRRLIRQSLIVKQKDSERVIEFLKRYTTTLFTRVVELTDEDRKILDSFHESYKSQEED